MVLICVNERCTYYEMARTVQLPEVAEGVYLQESYRCACGAELWTA